MFTFIISVLLVSFISLCFFKKKFWENRYLVLLISGGVALVATLTINYATRGKLETKLETYGIKDIQFFYVEDTLLIDSVPIITNDKWGFLNDFDDHNYADVVQYNGICIDSIFTDSCFSHIDTIKHTSLKMKKNIFFYNYNNILKIGYYNDKKLKKYYYNDVYIIPSESDTVSYISKIKKSYNPKSMKWVVDVSLPTIKTIKCFNIPPSEYAMIPDSLIRKLPFQL